jgi:L-serine dehydratase
MRAALDFARTLQAKNLLSSVTKVNCSLYGSLGSTGIGHGTPGAVIAGLSGLAPETCMPEQVRSAWSNLE